ncbi:MAG: quinolinate synthase NadA [Clostridiales bacterium]|nr:quinolinate synthase NadA [Clostridiales bacterium]MCF8023773.1 quinolinate synthase NadA [Clostridiales bacterium]
MGKLTEEEEQLYRIKQAKEKLGQRLLILGHHYQQDSVIQFADLRGDSFLLAQEAARSNAEYIIFLGVYFMAETADIVTSSSQKVIIPEPGAGCALAGMADIGQVEHCWHKVKRLFPGEVIPVTYVNSSAEIKAFCGKNGGLTCTSSSAETAFRWVFEQGKRILFFPDEHLGYNTALKIGFIEDKIALWDRHQGILEGSNDPGVILWNGFCPVHVEFTSEIVNKVKKDNYATNVVVHPECPRKTVEKADFNGSTEQIIKYVNDSKPGSRWAVGTDLNMVNRLRSESEGKEIISLNSSVSPCKDMMKINEQNLLWCLQNLTCDKIVNQVKVNSEVSYWAGEALKRMLSIR